MSEFLQSMEFGGAVALFLAGAVQGFAVGWFLHAWLTTHDRKKAMRSRSPQFITPEWRGFDRPEWHGETLVVDRRTAETQTKN